MGRENGKPPYVNRSTLNSSKFEARRERKREIMMAVNICQLVVDGNTTDKGTCLECRRSLQVQYLASLVEGFLVAVH